MSDKSTNAGAKPDYDHWSRMARWEKGDAAVLSIGLDPRDVSGDAAVVELPAAARQAYAQRRELVESHVLAGRLSHYPEPAEFLAWALANRIDAPPDLIDAVKAQAGVIKDWRTENQTLADELATAKARIAELESAAAAAPPRSGEERPLRPKEEGSLLKLVLGMAMHKYGFRPRAARTAATKQIVEGLAGCGIRLDEETALKWLRKAADEIDCAGVD